MVKGMNQPLSPEILCPNVKYSFIVKGIKYVAYFHRMVRNRRDGGNHCLCVCFCSDRNGKGDILFCDVPALVTNLFHGPQLAKTKTGVVERAA
jgi:hypothetical protein